MWSCYVTSTIKRLVLLFSLCCRNKIDCTHLIRISIVISSSTLLKMRHCHAIFHSIKFEKMLYDDSRHYDLHQTYCARVRKKSSFKGVLWQPIMIMMYVKSDIFCLLYWKREVVYHCSVLFNCPGGQWTLFVFRQACWTTLHWRLHSKSSSDSCTASPSKSKSSFASSKSKSSKHLLLSDWTRSAMLLTWSLLFGQVLN